MSYIMCTVVIHCSIMFKLLTHALEYFKITAVLSNST